MSRLFDDLKEGLREMNVYKKGKITLRSEIIEIPAPPTKYKPKDVKRIRKKGDYSQSVFACILNVSVKTVQSWESGERVPCHAALRLLEIIDKGIYLPKFIQKSA